MEIGPTRMPTRVGDLNFTFTIQVDLMSIQKMGYPGGQRLQRQSKGCGGAHPVLDNNVMVKYEVSPGYIGNNERQPANSLLDVPSKIIAGLCAPKWPSITKNAVLYLVDHHDQEKTFHLKWLSIKGNTVTCRTPLSRNKRAGAAIHRTAGTDGEMETMNVAC